LFEPSGADSDDEVPIDVLHNVLLGFPVRVIMRILFHNVCVFVRHEIFGEILTATFLRPRPALLADALLGMLDKGLFALLLISPPLVRPQLAQQVGSCVQCPHEY
jgi:hypothetical protein